MSNTAELLQLAAQLAKRYPEAEAYARCLASLLIAGWY